MFTAGGCRRVDRQPSPQAVLDSVEQTFESGDLDGAQHRAAAAFRDAAEGTVWKSVYRVELARVYLYQGRNPDALTLLAQPMPDSAPELARARWHTVRALAMDRTSDFAGAERELAEAERESAGASGLPAAEIESAFGNLNLDESHLDEAERRFRAALGRARAGKDLFLETQILLNLGVVSVQQQHDEEALAQLAGAQRAAEAIGARLQLEKVIGTAGYALYDLGDFPGAQQRFQEAQRQAEALGAPIDRIRWLTNEGLSAFRQGDHAEALRAYGVSLKEAEAIGMQEGISDAHANLASLMLDSDPGAAAAHIRETARIAAMRHHRPDQMYAALLEGMLWARTNYLAEAAQRLTQLDQDDSLIPSLRWQTEQELARVNLRMEQDAAAERWFRRAIGTFHRQRLSLEKVESTLPFLENGTDLYSDYVQFLVDRGRTDEALTVVDQSRAEALLSSTPPQASVRLTGGTGVAARRRLAASLHGAILVYYVLPKESYLWVTTPERSAFFRVAGGVEIRPLMEAHRRAILEARDLLAEAQPTGRVLFEKLLGPAASMLQPGERVFLVGDGALSELNFETLVHAEGQPHFWIDDVVLTHVPSLRLLRPAHGAGQRGALGGKMLLLGDPQYRADEYQSLPKAAEEVQDVQQHFAPESRTVLTGAKATPAAYRQERPGEFQYIHFVAHSTANTLKPLDSAVILSRGGDGTDKLYAREIVTDRLRAELVTISGCDSSGARVYAGEGTVGLAWAFERAGARNVIGALWEVNDASTPALMDRLYGGLLRGAAPDVALRAAKLELLHSPGVFRKPLYWAPFQLYSRFVGTRAGSVRFPRLLTNGLVDRQIE